jgi:hypothetical protein
MVFSDDHSNEKLRGQPKGLKRILQARENGLVIIIRVKKKK